MAEAGDKSTPTLQFPAFLAPLAELPAEDRRRVLETIERWTQIDPVAAMVRGCFLEPIARLELIAEEERRSRVLELLESAKCLTPKQPRTDPGYQSARVAIKLAHLFPNGIPSEEELSNAELVGMVVEEFEKEPKIPGLGIPSPKTILRQAGRIQRKK